MGISSIASAVKDPKQLLRGIGAVPCKIGDLILDVVVQERVDFSWTLTTYKSESGKPADLREKDPTKLVLDVVFLDKQYGVTDLISNGLSGEGFAPATWRDKYDRLKDEMDNGEPRTISIGLDSFPSMLIKSVGIVRNKKQAGYLSASITLEHVEIVSTDFVQIDNSLMPALDEATSEDEKASSKKSKPAAKKKNPKKPNTKQRESTLHALLSK